MENRGDLLEELALICDAIEKTSVQSKSYTLILEVSKVEFEKVFDYIQARYKKSIEISMDKINSFSITIGVVDIVFNTSNA